MTKRILTLGDTFRRLATRHDEEVLGHEDSPDAATDILGDEIEKLARAIASIPTGDLNGIRVKAAVFAHYRGCAFDENNHDVGLAAARGHRVLNPLRATAFPQTPRRMTTPASEMRGAAARSPRTRWI